MLSTLNLQPVRGSRALQACHPIRRMQSCCAMKATLYDTPVSNHGARVRYVIYKKNLEDIIDIVSPQALGGLKSPEYLALNPQGKMPLLVLSDGTAIAESEVINQYVLDAYKDQGPSLLAATPELRAIAALASRIHDIYITPIQGCMYKAMDADQRAGLLEQLVYQMDALEGVVVGPYIAGEAPTGADATLVGTFVFLTYILPRYFGWEDVFVGRPKLAAWWRQMNADVDGARVIKEVHGGLEKWSESNRWEKLGITEQVANSSYRWALDKPAAAVA